MSNTIKVCSKCGKEKSISEFYKMKHHKKDGLRSECKKCTAKYARERHQRLDFKILKRGYDLQQHYNLTYKQHLEIYVNQDGQCAICNRAIPYSKIVTDHDHKTGKVRGLLCRYCNIGMGFVDNEDFLEKAKQYKH